MNIQEMQGAVEAILFAAGEPLEPDKIAASLLIDKEMAVKIIRRLFCGFSTAIMDLLLCEST